ncbi:transcriptional regulator, CdaR family [Herbiconiux ginsengi]|uniref:Transcriptional regulator, CdaR family n=2 Tax=Herbiconiux ginsengi TaxID=381665 RepID=A0A1H3MV27_9MICO|nr:transcriptional regulator, CdaR family [Herbiconiux ginsengi]
MYAAYAGCMPATLSALLAHRPFLLRRLTAAPENPVVIAWAHSSDLADPSPFLVEGQMLLTTGGQFSADGSAAFASQYVARLQAAGVVALGFGTEVVREGTPGELVEACTRLGMPLVEVPYQTPFIAIARWVAEVQSTEARSRVDWALTTQRSVSLAALAGGGLAAAVRTTASGLGCDIAVFDPDAEVSTADSALSAASRRAFASIRPDVQSLLQNQRRARVDMEIGGMHVSLQTLGGSRRLRGVLALAKAGPFDAAELSVVTTLIALAEVSLERSQDQRMSLRALMVQLFELLRDGRVAAVRKALGDIPTGLPEKRFVVVSLRAEETDPALRDTLERRASDRRNRLFVVEHGDAFVLLADERRWPELRRLLTARQVRAGVSGVVDWDSLDAGLVQAARSLDRAGEHEIVDFATLVSSSFFGLLSATAVADVARSRLHSLLSTAEGRQRLFEATVWLRHNGQWEPAARELGIHRHSLRSRLEGVERALGLSLDRFQDRAELWALLAAIDMASGDVPAPAPGSP